MRKVQTLVAILVPVVLLAGAAYADRELGTRDFEPGTPRSVSSGVWLCPHGGGPEGWQVFLQVANPGERTATVRVRSLGKDKPAEPETVELEPGSFARFPVPAEGRGSASIVEWFGDWVAVGWLAHAGGGEGGVAVEPCAPAAGQRWLLPDGTTQTEGDADFVVVMNPFAREAVFSITLLSERKEPVQHSSLTDVVLRPFRSVAFNVNDVVLGEPTVSSLVRVSVGRVAAATLGVSGTGGIRSALGYLGVPPPSLTFPGGADAGRSQLIVMNAAATTDDQRVTLAGDIVGDGASQPFAGLSDSGIPNSAARTFLSATSGTTSIELDVKGDEIAAVRRTFGTASDQAAVTGAEPSAAWVVLPAVAGDPSNPGLVLSNPGSEPAVITLRYLAPGPADEVSVTVEPGSTVQAPEAFLRLAPEVGVLAEASSGTFIPASASYSLGPEGVATYAVALGIAVP